MSRHLWEVDHPYYCADNNYFDRDCSLEFPDWQTFVEDDDGGDFDLNLVFRWDWRDAENVDAEFDGCEVLSLYFMGQRKGLFRVVHICVEREDEPAIREWLSERFTHLLKLWEPLATPNPDGGTEG